MNLDLFCKQISLNLGIFGKNGGDFIEENYVSIEIILYTCGYQILVLLNVFEILFSTCKLDWIPNSSSFLHIWLQLSKLTFPIFAPILLTWNH